MTLSLIWVGHFNHEEKRKGNLRANNL